ncbi:MAG: sterol carrier protein domain-containing protein [Cyanobacteria bacterium J06621_8]
MRINKSDRQLFVDLQAQQAQLNNGNLARHQGIWQKILTAPEQGELFSYLLGDPNQPEGYIIFTQKKNKLQIRDWVILTATAARRLWSFFRNHRSQINEITWWGSPINPWLLLLPEQSATMVKQKDWMLRIIDLPQALTQRGYPPELTAELHLEIQDELLPQNNGKFRLQVSQGIGVVNQGGKGDLQINIRHFAPLYTGLLTPRQLRKLNYLQATPEALGIASLIFTGDRPWMADFF